MQWSAQANAGFSEAAPWLPVAEDFARVNVEAQRNDPRSMLTLYQRLIALRRGEPALEVGRFEARDCEGDVLPYFRRGREGESSFLVALNLGPRPHRLRGVPDGTIALTTGLDRDGERVRDALDLRSDEGVVIRLAAPQ